MELERHQIELRYESIRIRDRSREARLAASLLAEGQRQPVLVFADEGSGFVLVDGYRRVRALAALGRDTVAAMDLSCDETEALLRAWRLGAGRRSEALEEGWLVRELMDTQGVQQRDLARRMGRSGSWICRRLALIQVLPAAALGAVRAGDVCAHVAQKVLVPLARANREHCEQLVETLVRERPSSRQMAQWWRAWRAGDATVRERLVREPMLYLRAVATADRHVSLPAETPEGSAARRLGAVAGACWKARTELDRVLATHPEVSASESVHAAVRQTRTAWSALEGALEVIGAGRSEANDHPHAGR
jgi:ParB/RepB/Spo0J family partition protein